MTLPERLANAAVSYVAYLGQLFVPVGLSAFYSYPEAGRPAWQVAAAVALLLAITAAAVIGRRSYPYFFVGWFWYVGMLLPVLGLTSVGAHARADRYTYLSQIGLYIALVWGAMRLGASWPARRWVFGIGSALVLAALMACTWRQTGFWQDDKTLWEHALACDPKNVTAHYTSASLGAKRTRALRVAQYRQALELAPNERNIYYMDPGRGTQRPGRYRGPQGRYCRGHRALRAGVGIGSRLCAGPHEPGKPAGQAGEFRRGHGPFPTEHRAGARQRGRSIATWPWRWLSTERPTRRSRIAARPSRSIPTRALRTRTSPLFLPSEATSTKRSLIFAGRSKSTLTLPALLPVGSVAPHSKEKRARPPSMTSRATRPAAAMPKPRTAAAPNWPSKANSTRRLPNFRAAIAAYPDYAQAHCNLADALASQGKSRRAIAHYRQALEIDPDFAPAKQGSTVVESLVDGSPISVRSIAVRATEHPRTATACTARRLKWRPADVKMKRLAHRESFDGAVIAIMSQAPIQPKPSAQRGRQRRADAWRAIAVCGFLVVAVLLVFSRTLSQGFLNFDDIIYVYDEPHVSGGFSWSGIAWAFTNGPVGEWYPLSMLSHMLDCQLYGLNPAGHHLTNLLLHAASAVTLFLVLWRMTGALWPSALVAALFALHPLRVESVAWVAERRDVLSGLFFMLTLGAYGEYVRHPRSLGRYLAVVGLFALGLMAKPMLVTLPPLLLLLDFWPLGRFRPSRQPDTAAPSVAAGAVSLARRSWTSCRFWHWPSPRPA